MLTLAFDTATPWGRFALAEDGALLQYRPLNVMGSYADALLTVVEEILERNQRDRADLEGIAVTSGPGSFTGLRIGVATAKGLAYGLGCRLTAVNSRRCCRHGPARSTPGGRCCAPSWTI
ncbi:tRNA (adenosine(37)-N6)-threonylcarbamoyltransferase complex dimerization subunit type 1 TsaB [bacterium DOLJORAL78_65_58]|nr:MAG: tRNA (adenosine(37)-N6)-threonylcarbamoyltransferase complex dimerization subunit type 1 TsaB [bacterium DOLJORAL78_65_58]